MYLEHSVLNMCLRCKYSFIEKLYIIIIGNDFFIIRIFRLSLNLTSKIYVQSTTTQSWYSMFVLHSMVGRYMSWKRWYIQVPIRLSKDNVKMLLNH